MAGTSPRTASPTTCARSTAIDADAFRRLRRDLGAPLPHPDPTTLRHLADLTADWALNHFTTLPDQSVGRPATRSETESLLREPPPEVGQPFAEVLAQFDERVAPLAVRVNHPRFFAFVPGAPNFLSVLGDWLCASSNFFAGVWLEAAGPSQVELLVLDWFKEFVGYPADAGGVLTGGGSEATLTALVAARDRLGPSWVMGVLYTSEQRHWSVDRAAHIIGLHPRQIRSVPVDDQCRMRPDELAEMIRRDRARHLIPLAVVANAGTTNTGAVDPLSVIADLCQREGAWLHVDAAYGWPMVLTDDGRRLLDGIGRADSLTLDPHKWFGQTFEAGCVLVRESGLLERSFSLRPEYMQDVEPDADEVNFGDRGIALTRRFRALKIWLSVKVLGVGWYRALVDRCCRLAEFAEELIRRTPVFEVLSAARMSVVCFRHVRPGLDDVALNQWNLNLIDEMRATRRAFISSTKLNGRVALRFCFVNWRTTAADVEAVVTLLGQLAGPAA